MPMNSFSLLDSVLGLYQTLPTLLPFLALWRLEPLLLYKLSALEILPIKLKSQKSHKFSCDFANV